MNINTFSGDFFVNINTFSGDFCAKLDFLLIITKNCDFLFGISWGKKCFVFVGGGWAHTDPTDLTELH